MCHESYRKQGSQEHGTRNSQTVFNFTNGRQGSQAGKTFKDQQTLTERTGARDPEGQEGPGAGGAQLDPGHSHDDGPRWSRWREEPWRSDSRRLQGADQRRRSRWWRSPRRRANEPGGCRGSRGARVEPWALRPRRRRRSGEEPVRLRTQVELKGGRSPTEPVGWSDKTQPEERSPEAMAGQCPTKAEPEGWGSPVELVDQWVTVEARELGAEVEPLGLRAEAESGPRRLEAEVRDTPAPAMLEDGRPTGLAP